MTAVSINADLHSSRYKGPNVGSIDTSYLFEEFKREFLRNGVPIEVDFRKLVGWVKLGDQLTHQVHPYPAKLLPHIASFFLDASVLRGDEEAVVLDPFCGSGTVALEASVRRRRSLVVDANPFALLLTRVKTTPYDPALLLTEVRAIARRARRYRVAPSIEIVNAHYWYSERLKTELDILLRAVKHAPDEVQDFFLVCFSSAARRLSFADPSITVPVRLQIKDGFSDGVKAKLKQRLSWLENVDAVEEFQRICLSNLERVAKTNRSFPERKPAKQIGIDARKLQAMGAISVKSVPLILTSPPYGSAQKYVRAASLSLNWLGLAKPADLAALEMASIGREHIRGIERRKLPRLSRNFEDLLTTIGKCNPRREEITRFYLCELQEALFAIGAVLAPGGTAVMVVGNNRVSGHLLRTDAYIVEVLETMGLTLTAHLVDSIKSRGLMTRRNATASMIDGEHILVFQKGQ